MTRIRATCPTCGEVDLRPDEVVLHVVRAPDGLVADGSGSRAGGPPGPGRAPSPAAVHLARCRPPGGARGAGPARGPPRPPGGPAGGPPLTPDDLLDLHLSLERDDWFEELLRTV